MPRSFIELPDIATARILFGPNDAHQRLLRERLGVSLVLRDNRLQIEGEEKHVEAAIAVLDRIIGVIDPDDPKGFLEEELQWLLAGAGESSDGTPAGVLIPGRQRIEPKSRGQAHYLDAIRHHDIVFGIGPAGTGKTYLAVACAVEALKLGRVQRIVLTRPAVEAGERLGFLPGDMRDKVHPYLQPLYDGLGDMLNRAELHQYFENGIIEVVPLAFMRGRTLNRAFVILDEAQNTTPGQMKMFLTRLGRRSRAVVTGDVTQVDLDEPGHSGLIHAQAILSDVAGMAFILLTRADVVRHNLVRDIIRAYEQDEKDA